MRLLTKKYRGVGLYPWNVRDYLYERDYFGPYILKCSEKDLNVNSFMQRDFNDDKDCVFTSFLTLVYHYLHHMVQPEEIYDSFEPISNEYFNGRQKGEEPFYFSTVLNNVLRYFGLSRKVHGRYIKYLGYNHNTIKKIIDEGSPVLLYISKDWNDYYKNNAVVVYGYSKFSVGDRDKIMFKVHDSYTDSCSYIDFDTLGMFSFICY